MENMIKKIVDADNEAKAMEKDTLEEKEELSKTIEAETKKIYDDFMAKAEGLVVNQLPRVSDEASHCSSSIPVHPGSRRIPSGVCPEVLAFEGTGTNGA